MGGSNSKSVVTSMPPPEPLVGFRVKISFDGQELADNRAGSDVIKCQMCSLDNEIS